MDVITGGRPPEISLSRRLVHPLNALPAWLVRVLEPMTWSKSVWNPRSSQPVRKICDYPLTELISTSFWFAPFLPWSQVNSLLTVSDEDLNSLRRLLKHDVQNEETRDAIFSFLLTKNAASALNLGKRSGLSQPSTDKSNRSRDLLVESLCVDEDLAPARGHLCPVEGKRKSHDDCEGLCWR